MTRFDSQGGRGLADTVLVVAEEVGGMGVPAAWRAIASDEPLGPVEEPVPVLMKGFYEGTRALVRRAGRIRPLPALGQTTGSARMVLGDAGRVVLFERIGWHTDETLPWDRRRFSEGIYRARLSDLSVQRAPYDPPANSLGPVIGLSCDGRHALIGRTWSIRHVPPRSMAASPSERQEHWELIQEMRRTTFTLVDFQAGTARELDTIPALAGGGLADDLPVQFSPDGTLVAVFVLVNPPRGEMAWSQTRLYRVDTGDLVETLDKVTLVGSRSWSSDGMRLLVGDWRRSLILDLTTGEMTQIPGLPIPRADPPGYGKHRLLGFTDRDDLFTATQRGKAMTLWRTSLSGEPLQALARWSGSEVICPTLGPTPPGYWDQDR